MKQLENRPDNPLRLERFDARRRTRVSTAGSEGASVAGGFKLSIAMAARNEERTIREAIGRILAVPARFDIELIVVDDGSTDRTLEIVRSFDDPRLVLLVQPRSQGKGAAILAAAGAATGTHILIFDADLEYLAADIPALVEPVMSGVSPVVYGARVQGVRTLFQTATYALGSKATTVFANLLFGSGMRDMHTCLKLMPLRLFRELCLSESGFGLDTEITGELLRRGIRPYEVPCSYRGRTIADGKKISARDGVECVKLVFQVRLRGRVDYDVAMLEPLRVLSGEAFGGPAAGGTALAYDDGLLAVAGLQGRSLAAADAASRLRRDAVLSASGGGSKAL